MADGGYRLGGGAPEPDRARIEAIAATWGDQDDGAFGAAPHGALSSTLDRTLSETRNGDLTEASALIAHLRNALDGLAPASLEPRRGLAGLFDSRKRRLKALRARYLAASRTLNETGIELTDRADRVERRSRVLEDVWADIRNVVTDLDAHVVAGADRCPPVPAADEGEAVPDAAAPLRQRLSQLSSARQAGIRTLPLIRMAQNAEVSALACLQRLPQAIGDWRDDWKDALGLMGKRQRKVRPDPVRLARTRDALMAALDQADAAIAAARTRRAEIEARMDAVRKAV